VWTNDPSVNINANGMEIKGEGDLKIGDRSMKEFMDKVEDQLAILRPAPELEEKWNQLKELRRQYEECKQDILEKEKIMKILKEE
jgi:phosphomannomutase